MLLGSRFLLTTQASPRKRDHHSKEEQGERDEVEGSPRSVSIRFTFHPNEWFEDEVLEKKFWFRRRRAARGGSGAGGEQGWCGLVSEPVRIRWKGKGKDLTEGLTDAVYRAWMAEKKQQEKQKQKQKQEGKLSDSNDGDININGKEDAKEKGKGKKAPKMPILPEHRELDKKLQGSTEGALSFFTWFAYRGPHVTAEESALATAEAHLGGLKGGRRGGDDDDDDDNRKRKRGAGDAAEEGDDASEGEEEGEEKKDDEDEDEDEENDMEREVFPNGEELAVAISEDLFPSAMKYFSELSSFLCFK